MKVYRSLTSISIISFAFSTLLTSGMAHAAENYPNRPVRLIVQFSPGGNVDTTARVIARQLTQQLGQQFIVDNRPGANGTIGLELLTTSTPDGYTLGIGFIGNFAINPHLFDKTRYDPLRDFTAISRTANAPNILAVHPSVPAKTLTEFVRHAKANPGHLTYGTGGVGTINHLAMELLSRRADIKLLHVPYKGSGQAITDLVGGNVKVMFGGPPSIAPHVRTGKLHALGITTLQRSPAFPEIPTIAESGYPGFQAVAWMGIIGPSGMPSKVVERLNTEIRKALKNDEVMRTLGAIGFELSESSPLEFTRFIKEEYDTWGKVIREQKIQK